MADFQELAQAVIRGDAKTSESITRQLLEDGVGADQIVNQGLIEGMSVVGTKFKNNEYYVPEVLIAARAMKTSMNMLRPLLAESDIQPVGKIVLGTVRGDLHDIGKNLVAMMMEGAGFAVTDLGVDVSAEQFLQAAQDQAATLIGLSALLTTTMVGMKDIIEAVRSAGLKGQVKIMIGGAPVTQSFADEIGADGYAPDAASAVDCAKELLGAA